MQGPPPTPQYSYYQSSRGGVDQTLSTSSPSFYQDDSQLFHPSSTVSVFNGGADNSDYLLFAPSISSHGVKGSETLRIDYDSTISLSRPHTTESAVNLAQDSPLGSPFSTGDGKRTKSADSIRKLRSPGHTFTKLPRTNSPKTERIIQQLLHSPVRPFSRFCCITFFSFAPSLLERFGSCD
jgi:hypothetical protein